MVRKKEVGTSGGWVERLSRVKEYAEAEMVKQVRWWGGDALAGEGCLSDHAVKDRGAQTMEHPGSKGDPTSMPCALEEQVPTAERRRYQTSCRRPASNQFWRLLRV